MPRSFVSVLMPLAAAMCIACGSDSETATRPADTVQNTAVLSPAATATPTPDELAGGRRLYNDNCAVCHKENGTGGKVTVEGRSMDPDDLSSAKIIAFSDEKIRNYIVKGVPSEGMPAFGNELSPQQIDEIVVFVRKEIQKK